MSTKFMVGIVNEKFWMLKSEHVTTIKACPYPPKKADLADILYDALTNNSKEKNIQRTACLIVKRPPAKEWMLLVLAQIDPTHLVFTKA